MLAVRSHFDRMPGRVGIRHFGEPIGLPEASDGYGLSVDLVTFFAESIEPNRVRPNSQPSW